MAMESLLFIPPDREEDKKFLKVVKFTSSMASRTF
jgi:hypothetical protein